MFGRDATIAGLGAFSLVLWLVLTRLAVEGAAEVAWWSVGNLAWPILGWLVLAWIFARLSRPQIEFRRTLLLLAGLTPLVITGLGVAEILGLPGAFIVWGILAALTFSYLAHGLTILSGKTQRPAFGTGVIWVAALLYVGNSIYFDSSIWYSPEPDAFGSQPTIGPREREQLQFDQALRVADSLRELARDPSLDSQMFFLGFAGYGSQRVFAEEIDLTAKRIDARYGTPRRSLRLVNDRRALDSFPMASAPAIRNALLGLAEVMDVERDVLFLALSSHGSEDGSITVENGFMFGGRLDAADLRKMLDEAKIRWRVVVVSACYAGTFIEPLRSENTIVITAAAADKTSFGCSDDRDLTYFGEAFYRDALPNAASLRGAFDAAKLEIARREARETLTTSDPQAFFGPLMEAKLAELEAARSARLAGNTG